MSMVFVATFTFSNWVKTIDKEHAYGPTDKRSPE